MTFGGVADPGHTARHGTREVFMIDSRSDGACECAGCRILPHPTGLPTSRYRRGQNRPKKNSPWPERPTPGTPTAASTPRGKSPRTPSTNSCGPVISRKHVFRSSQVSIGTRWPRLSSRRPFAQHLTDYRDEPASWTGRSAAEPEGIPRSRTPARYAVRRSGAAGLRAHCSDPRGNRIRTHRGHSPAGEHHHRRSGCPSHGRRGDKPGVLCTATLRGLASSPLSEAFEVEQTRDSLRQEVLGGVRYPQLAIRAGLPANGQQSPLTPGRPVLELLRLLPDSAP
ncbi:hypothetical protein DFQ14_11511 [Halopolyspora algeriensis]|uniref:Uncharacterized protein n=1 Tax=Halopolyspora algeriensis TaxID=1500506 RepID=A0A368VHG1_9ACTN|nr:hypothetical protein DFQ14_11511 [Halopolyspora algeriensis]TQM54072.1 hypothetical protein FHU43_2250 [Halopolyspora algeriensis]